MSLASRLVSILCYGAVNPDLVHHLDRIPGPGDDVRSRRWSFLYGGKAANAAAALAAWHADPVLLGLVLGADPLADALEAALERAGVDTSWLERDPSQATRHCVVLVTPEGERTIVCTGYLDASWQRVPPGAWDGARAVLLDGFGGEAALRTAVEGRRRALPLVWVDAPAGAVEAGDLVIWSRHEHRLAEAQGLAARGVRVVLTAGSDPATVWWDGTTSSVTPPAVDVADATGSGDVLAAGCAYGLARGWEPERIVRWAVAAGAALAARGREAGMPSVSDVEALASA